MEKEKDSKLKQAMKGLDSFLTTHYSFRYNQITEQCEFHDKHKFDKYRVVDEREFNTLVINAIEEGVNCMDRDMRRYLGSSRIPSFHPVTAYLEHLPHWDALPSAVPHFRPAPTPRAAFAALSTACTAPNTRMRTCFVCVSCVSSFSRFPHKKSAVWPRLYGANDAFWHTKKSRPPF